MIVPWTREGPGQAILLDKGVTSQCLAPHTDRCSFALGFDGTLYILNGTEVHVSKALPDDVAPDPRCWMFSIRQVGDFVFSVGMSRSVYRRLPNGTWQSFNVGVEVIDSDEIASGFRDIDGIDPERLTSVGLNGEVWHYGGTSWARAASPTNVHLDAVRYIEPEVVVACCARGTVIRGYGAEWALIECDDSEEDLISVECFEERVFVATRRRVYELVGNRLLPVNMDLGRNVTTGYLSAAKGSLWSVGNTDIVYFDGAKWSEIPSPYQKGRIL